ncbi:MAG TPA: hypothetical protein VGW96_07615 [Candidatus Eremiobacteraceae bacterium]|jgi:hypothetical protein|nr:hypothetical protein [Candidatus Eremiobacteraceae bacterium]
MMTLRVKFTVVSLSILLVVLALTLFVAVQPSSGQYPALPVYSNNGARYVFRPPQGWHRVQQTAIGLGVWVHPGDTGYSQNISVRAEDFGGTLADFAQQIVSRNQSEHPDAKIGSLQRTTVCQGHAATYLTWAAPLQGQVLVYEEMLTIYGGTAYVATYARATNQASSPSARYSLTTLCGGNPPGTITQTPSPIPGVYTSPTPPVLTNTPQPAQTYGTAAPTVTPRLVP